MGNDEGEGRRRVAQVIESCTPFKAEMWKPYWNCGGAWGQRCELARERGVVELTAPATIHRTTRAKFRAGCPIITVVRVQGRRARGWWELAVVVKGEGPRVWSAVVLLPSPYRLSAS